MAKQYEVYYYRQTGISSPMDSLEEVKELLFNETAANFDVEQITENFTVENNEGEALIVRSFEDGFADDEEEEG